MLATCVELSMGRSVETRGGCSVVYLGAMSLFWCPKSSSGVTNIMPSECVMLSLGMFAITVFAGTVR